MTIFVLPRSDSKTEAAALASVLGSVPTDADVITHGSLSCDADLVFIGIEPPDRDHADWIGLKSWDEPVEREPGWAYFGPHSVTSGPPSKGIAYHSSDLVAVRTG